MATAILKQIFDLQVVRTRDIEVLNGLELIYDIGDGEFDHHQVEKEYREGGVPYAACGLIWKKFGKRVVSFSEPSLNDAEVEAVARYIDSTLMQGIDAADNGLRTSITIIPTTNISMIISGFNPTWDECEKEEVYFSRAVEAASMVFENTLRHQISAIKAKTHIQQAYNNRPRPEVLVLDNLYPWQRLLSQIDTENEVLFVICPRLGEYLIQTVRSNEKGLRDKKKLPEAWAGKRDEELNKIIGIDDALFCHSARFIAGAKSFESIMKMADIAIAEIDVEIDRGWFYGLKKLVLKKFKFKDKKHVK